MHSDKSKENILKQLYDISLLDEPVNLETIDGIPPNRKLHTIYYNLVWGLEPKLPKIDGIKSLLILLEYMYNKFSEVRKISPHLISRKNEIFYLLIDQLLKIPFDKIDKENVKVLEQYFYDSDFFSSFLLMLNKLKNVLFNEKFSFFSKVSIYYNLYFNYFISFNFQSIQNVLEDNLELSQIFKKRIINDLFTKYDFIKTLIQENQKNSENEDEASSNDFGEINKNKKKCMKIVERLKFIFDQFRNNYDRSVKNLAFSIDKFLLKRKIDIRADLKSVANKIKENESLNAQRNKEIKDTLEELKYKIKGYSAKKDKNILFEEENKIKIKGKKINFDTFDKNEKFIPLDKKIKYDIKEQVVEEEKEEIKEIEEKVTGKKRLRGKKKKNEKNKGEEEDKEELSAEKKKKKLKKQKIQEEIEEKVEIIDSEEKEEEESEENEESEDKNESKEKNKKLILRGKKKKIKKENKDDQDNNIKIKKNKKLKKEENNKDENEEENTNIKKRGRKILKSPVNKDSLVNENQIKNNKLRVEKDIKEIKSPNKKINIRSPNKKEMEKSQNQKGVKINNKKEIPKSPINKKLDKNEDKKKEIVKEEKSAKKREFSGKKEKENDIQIIEIIPKKRKKNIAKEKIKISKKPSNIDLKEEEENDSPIARNLRNRPNILKNEKDIKKNNNRWRSKSLNKERKKSQSFEKEETNKKRAKKEILLDSNNKNLKRNEKLKIEPKTKNKSNLLGKKRNASVKENLLRMPTRGMKKKEITKSSMTLRKK